MSNIIHLFAGKKKEHKESHALTESLDISYQMSLPFSAPHTLYVQVGEPDPNSEDLFLFIERNGIGAFFDLRLSPRLDFVATTRQKAFTRFHNSGISYYDVFGRSGVASIEAAVHGCLDISKEVIFVVEENFKNGEPCIVIFDNHQLSKEYLTKLNQYFDIQKIDPEFIQDTEVKTLRKKM